MRSVTARFGPLVGTGAGMLVLASLAGCGSETPPTERATRYGVVVGADNSATTGTYAWLGVPYAKPPVGALRWRPPVEPDASADKREARSFGAACIQNGRIFGPGANNRFDATIATTLNMAVGSEDCLTLNIWRPANADIGLPVIVFVHGGSNISGYSADPVHDGAALAKSANAVVVTMNYRLGVFGFLLQQQLRAAAGGNTAEASGNFALLDLLQALRYVNDNIESFGGNRGNVTLMGQSAGANNVWALLTSPLSAGLFHKLIPISGGISLPSNLPAGSLGALFLPAQFQAQGDNLLFGLLIADGRAADVAAARTLVATMTTSQVADYLRSKSAAAILGVVLARGLGGSGPITDGNVVPLDPIAAIAAGRYQKVPVLVGNTEQEGTLFGALMPLIGRPAAYKVTDAMRFTLMANFNGDLPTTLTEADLLEASYLPSNAPTTGWTASAARLTSVFTSPARDNVLNTLKTQQSNVWHYQFDWKQEPAPWNTVYGASHAFDLPFIFNNFGPSLFAGVINSSANREGRLALSTVMSDTVATFARSGDPNHAGLGTRWGAWPAVLHFDATLTQPRISVR